MSLSASDVIAILGLEPHVQEGGYFRETYRSKIQFGASSLSTAIYYLLTPNTRSHMHCLYTDEVFHFYLGDAVEQLQLWPDGSARIELLGPDLPRGHRVQLVVPGGVWQGARLLAGGNWALMGTTMAPGFRPEEFRLGERESLSKRWPAFSELIRDLTR